MVGAYVRLIRVSAFCAFPLLGLMFVGADDVVHLVYGDRYAAVAPILRIFVLFTVIRCFTANTGTIFNILGRPDLSFRVNLATAPVYLMGAAVGARWGATGVAIGVTVVRAVAALLIHGVAMRLLGGRGMDVVPVVGPLLIASVLSSAVYVGMTSLLSGPLARTVAIGGLASAATFGVLVKIIDARALDEALGLLNSFRRKTRAGMDTA